MKIYVGGFFENLSKKLVPWPGRKQFVESTRMTRIMDSLQEDLCTYVTCRWILLRMRTGAESLCSALRIGY
jgi:hypothetical protein